MNVLCFFNKVKRKWMKIRLQPIRVFCFHHVSDTYDAATMWEEDWTQTEALQQFVKELQSRGYVFIPLSEAHERLKHDWIRRKKYAVLTADDGFKTLLNIVPWLNKQQIPITLFVNPKYILEDGKGENVQVRLDVTKESTSHPDIYLSKSDVAALESPLLSFAYHGYEHLDEKKMDEAAFVHNIEKGMVCMRDIFPNIIPFYAHTYGLTRKGNDDILNRYGLTPVYVSGGVNYNDSGHIDRELISNERIQNGKVHV